MQTIFTFMAPICSERVEALRDCLTAIQAGTPGAPNVPFMQLTKLHFGSFVVLDDATHEFDPWLVFENNIDGTIAAHVEQLCEIAGPALHTIFAHCADYRAPAFERYYLRHYLLAHVRLPAASFVGNVGRSVGRIRAEQRLVDRLESRLDQLVAASVLPSRENLYAKLIRSAQGTDPWAFQPCRRISARDLFFRRLAAFSIVFSAITMVLNPLTLPVVILFIVVLRVHEMRDRAEPEAPSLEDLAIDTASEDKVMQNHFASVAVVKDGAFRRFTLRAVLFAINRLARSSVFGTLSGLHNIHFAHWVLIDGGRRLLFLTNYDGSWENYLDDFIEQASPGLTAIWSNVKDFPKTNFLVRGGARNEKAFKAIARQSQVPTLVWFSAYTDRSVPTIENNSALRDGLASAPRGTALGTWLQRL